MVFLEALDAVTESKRAEAIGQFDLFGLENSGSAVSGVDLDIPQSECEKMMLLSYEREMLG